MEQSTTKRPKRNLSYRASQIKRYKELPKEDQRYIDGAICTLLYKAGRGLDISKQEKEQ